jgi:hypothetical protein
MKTEANGVFIYLVKNNVKNLVELQLSLELLTRKTFKNYPYPVIIFHTNLGDVEISKIKSFSEFPITFAKIKFPGRKYVQKLSIKF